MILKAIYLAIACFSITHLQASSRAARALSHFDSQLLLTQTAKALGRPCPSFRHSFAEVNEVSARDGIQGEKQYIQPENKLGLIDALVSSVKEPRPYSKKLLPVRVGIGSMVSADAVPQMRSTEEILRFVENDPNVLYSVLVPNLKGMNKLKEVLRERGDDLPIEVAVFVSPVDESLRKADLVMASAKLSKFRTRGFISMAAGSPFGDTISPRNVSTVAKALKSMGCEQIVLGDTTGTGTPALIYELVRRVGEDVPVERLALHLHGRKDNWENTLQNVLAAYMAGVRSYDGSIMESTGCPYSPGAPGNLDMALLLTLFEGLGIKTRWNRDAILQVRSHLPQILGFGNGMIRPRNSLYS